MKNYLRNVGLQLYRLTERSTSIGFLVITVRPTKLREKALIHRGFFVLGCRNECWLRLLECYCALHYLTHKRELSHGTV